MATNFSNISILSAADSNIDDSIEDDVIDSSDVSGSFFITGSGQYTGQAPSDTSVTVKWTLNGQEYLLPNVSVLFSNIGSNGNGTFDWRIEVSQIGINSGLNFDSGGTVEVTFPGTTTASTTFDHACFHRGTRVLTRHGYCPVEELAVGDEVRTLQGGWQPLRWIGRQRITTPFGRAKGAPVRITAGAFGPSLPQQDILVSPGHAIFFRNHLIPAVNLINGVTVFYETEIRDIEYFHLLLDRHEVIFSEGLATESYVPCENIDWFDNTSECPERLLNAIRAGTAQCLRECYPRRVNGPVVETARALLARFVPVDVTGRAVG